MTASISAHDHPLGEYLVDIQGWDNILDQDSTFSHTIDVDAIPSLIQHLDNAYRSLMERRVKDAVCGNCKLCGNTRMVNNPPPHVPKGQSWSDHCPRCKPKLDKAREKGLLK